jgi:hypothetical protein
MARTARKQDNLCFDLKNNFFFNNSHCILFLLSYNLSILPRVYFFVVERDENEGDIFPVENELYALKLQT